MSKTWWFSLFLGIALVAIIVSLILTFGDVQEKEDVLVGVVMPGDVSELGWNGIHYKGVSEAAAELDAKLLVIENAKEGAGLCAAAIDSLIASGAKMIILASFNYAAEVADIIKAHPEVMFFSITTLDEENYRVYFSRVYQARYLSGIVAGLSTKNNKIGYVAAMNNVEVNRGINAFTLGVRKVKPNAKVYVTWTGKWDDAEKEAQNVDFLIDSVGVDLITYHQNQDWVIKEAESRGILSVGFNLDSSSYSPDVITSLTTNWKMVYREIIQDFLQKKKSITNYWVGIEKDAVGLSFYSPLVSDSVRALVNDVAVQMKNGMDIFRGPLYDNTGKRRCNRDEIVSDNVLRESMDWFVNGVVVYEK